MRFEGNPEVLRNLWRKQKLRAAGDVEHLRYRIAGLACPGLQRGVYAGGKARALERLRLAEEFDVLVGVSTGAPAWAFMLAGQLHQHLNVYWNEAATEEFASFKRFLLGRGPIISTDNISAIFRRKLDQSKVLRSRPDFFTGVTCATTGRGYLIDAKCTDPDPLEAVHASIAMPMLCGRVVEIGDRSYVDGSGAMGFPAREIIEQFEPTDLLVFANCPDEREELGILKTLLTGAMLSSFPAPVQRAFLARYRCFADRVRYLRNQHRVRWGIVWTDEEIGSFEFSPRKLERAADRADWFMTRLLTDAKVHVEHERIQSLAAE